MSQAIETLPDVQPNPPASHQDDPLPSQEGFESVAGAEGEGDEDTHPDDSEDPESSSEAHTLDTYAFPTNSGLSPEFHYHMVLPFDYFDDLDRGDLEPGEPNFILSLICPGCADPERFESFKTSSDNGARVIAHRPTDRGGQTRNDILLKRAYKMLEESFTTRMETTVEMATVNIGKEHEQHRGELVRRTRQLEIWRFVLLMILAGDLICWMLLFRSVGTIRGEVHVLKGAGLIFRDLKRLIYKVYARY